EVVHRHAGPGQDVPDQRHEAGGVGAGLPDRGLSTHGSVAQEGDAAAVGGGIEGEEEHAKRVGGRQGTEGWRARSASPPPAAPATPLTRPPPRLSWTPLHTGFISRSRRAAPQRPPRMQVYDADHIRNVALVGHQGSGKTTLAEAVLYSAGALPRMGSIEEGNTR